MHPIFEKISEILKSTRFQLFIITFLFYIQLITGFHSINEKSRFALILAIVEDNSFIINNYAYLTNYTDVSFFNGNYYSDKPPGLAVLGIPLYLFGKFLVNSGFLLFEVAFYIILISTVATSLSIVLIYDTCINLFQKNKNASLLTATVYGFGTIALVYSKSFFAHSFTAFLLLLGFYFGMKAVKFDENKKRNLLISGVAMGFIALVEYYPFLLLIPLGIYLMKHNIKRDLLVFLLPTIAFLAIHGIYNYICFSNPLTVPYYYEQAYDLQSIDYYIGNPIHIGLYGLLFSPFRGLFFYSPVLLLAFHGTYKFFKTHRDDLILYISSFSLILLLFSMDLWWYGGNCYGPRYLLPVIAFIAIPISASFEDYKTNKLFWVIFLALFSLSIFNNMIGAITFSHTAFVSPNPIMTSLLLALDGKVDYGLLGHRYIPIIYVVFSIVLVGHDKIRYLFRLLFQTKD